MADTVQRMGGKGLSAAEVASLEKFLLTGLHAPQHPPAASSEQVAAGKKLFESPQVGCSGCHIDGKTDGKSHDVATMSDADFQVQAQTKGVKPTGLAFDTPSLKGLFATAPYLHDGSAPNLDAVLKLSDQGKMGATKDLTDVQRGQLKAYLMSL
jgi:cytochrome c peroxidase